MPSISSGNNSGLYDIDSVNIPIDDNILANNITATGNVTVGGYIIANGSITTNSNFVGNLVGNLIGNIALAGSNTQVIFNDSGVTGGANAFTFNKATNAVAITGTLSATGNITGNYILGNGSQLTGLPATYSNANVVSLMASFGSNTISTSGNITGGYILGNGSQLTGLPQQYGNANVAAYLASGTNTQNIVTSGTVQGNILQTAGAGGNITGANYISANYFVGDGSLLTNVSGNLAGNMQGNILGNGFGISNLAFLSVTGASTLANLAITGGANIDVGNNRITNVATPSSGTDAATKDYVDSVASSGFTIEDDTANTTTVAGGDTLELLGTANQVSVAITANDQVTFGLPSAISVSGNITGGNINTAGALSATGNVNAGNSYITNDLTVGGTIFGTFSGNIAGNLVVPGANTEILFNNAGNAGASSDFTFNDGTNVMTLNGLANVLGNVQGGNITTAGSVSATGNVTANNMSVSTSGTLTVGSATLSTGIGMPSILDISASLVDVTNLNSQGNISGITVSATGNVTGGNILTGGLISATGNITANYYFGNGSQLTGITSDYGNANVANYLPTFTGNLGAGNLVMTSTSGVAYVNNITGLAGQPVSITADGTEDIHLDADSIRIGDNNTDATLTTHGTGDLILRTNEGSATEGNIIIRDGASGNIDIQTNGSGVVNITGTAGLRVADGISAVGNITVGNILTGGIMSASGNVIGGTGLYGALVSVSGNVVAGNVYTVGLVSATGNITAGNISTTGVFTASNVTANLQMANIITNNQQIQTVAARNPSAISATVADPGRIVIGTGYSGNLSPGNDLNSTGRGTRLLVSDNLTMGDTQQRTIGLGVQQYVAATANITNINTRVLGTSTQLIVGGGASGNTWGVTAPIGVAGGTNGLTIGGGTSGNLTAVGNTTVTAATSSLSSITINAGSALRTGMQYFGSFIPAANIGNAIGTATQFGGSTGYTGNVYVHYHPGTASDFGISTANIARSATNYYFLRNDDNVAQNKMGSMRLSHEYRYDTATTGSITIDKNNGQTQYIALTGNVTISGFSNFVVSASDGTTTDYQFDTVTLVFRNDSTGRTITMPTGATYKYAGNVSTFGTTANAVQMASVTAWDDSGTTRYLITLSPEFV